MKQWLMLAGLATAMGLVSGLSLPAAEPGGGATSPPAGAVQPVTRTRAQVEALIAEAGKVPPSWWDSVPLNYPPTLDLSWTPSKQWNNQKNLGQYLWDIVNPNPNRWREGVKLVHHALTVNRNNPRGLSQCIDALARMYGDLLEDWPRAVFWARKSGEHEMLLANAYWKMGCREMAEEVLKPIEFDDTRNGQVIKLWAEMGNMPKALAMAEDLAKDGAPDVAYLAAGDACRRVGQVQQAMTCYQKAMSLPTNTRGDDQKRNRERARASLEAVKLFDALDLSRIADGNYKSSSVAFAGPLEVTATVKSHRIEAVTVTSHKEKQFYSSITDTTGQIIAKQSVKGIDATSGATITSEAIINATAKALAGGMK